MSEELIGKTVSLREATEGGDTEYPNLTVVSVAGVVITLRETSGKLRCVNMSSPQIVEVKES